MTAQVDDVTITRTRLPRGGPKPTPSPAVPDSEIKRLLKRLDGPASDQRRVLSVSRIHDDFPTNLGWGVRSLTAVDIVDADLAGSSIGRALFSRTSMQDCRFERVRFDPFDGRRLDVVDCAFIDADFASRTYASVTRSTFLRTRFERCDLRYLTFDRCDFRSSAFHRPRTKRTMMERSTLADVTFSGRLGNLFFVNTVLTRVDFRDATPDELMFTDDSTLTDVQFPKRPDVFVVMEATFQAVGRQTLSVLTAQGQEWLGYYVLRPEMPNPRPIVVSRRFLSAMREPLDRQVLVDALYPHAIEMI